MKKYTTLKKYTTCIGAVVLLASSYTANAGLINVGGVTWDPDYFFGGPPPIGDLSLNTNFSQWFVASADAGTYDPTKAKDVLTVGTGDELQGSGRVTELNGFLNPTLGADLGFCLSCELTYEFGGLLADGAGGFTTANAFFNFYVETGANIDGVYTQGAAASTWLELQLDTLNFVGDNALGQYIGGAVNATFSAIGGLAKDNFDTNTVVGAPGGSDIAYSATTIFGLQDPTSAYDSTTNQYLYTNIASAIATGDSVAVSEPGMLAILGLGLGALSLGRFRRKSSSNRSL
jgi:hypothetical protein